MSEYGSLAANSLLGFLDTLDWALKLTEHPDLTSYPSADSPAAANHNTSHE